MANKAYVITSGSYSDYHIVAVFTDETKAKHFLKVYNRTNDRFFSAEMGTWPISDEFINVKRNEILVEYLPEGGYANTYNVGEDGVRAVEEDQLIQREYGKGYRYPGTTYPVFQFMLDIGSEDYSNYHERRDKINKIARDRYAAYMARQEGV